MKRILAIILTAVMLVGCIGILASCGAPEVQSTIVDGKFDPAITITWAYPFVGSGQETVDHHKDADGNPDWTTADTSWTRLAQEQYGIKMKLEWEIHDGGAYIDKLNNAVFLGEIPDYVNCLYDTFAIDFVKKLYDADLIQSIDEAIEQYACEDYKNAIEYVGEQVFYSATFGGKIYALPHIVVGNSKNVVWWIRQDWLDNVNKTVPTDWDEFKDVMMSFANQDPDGNNIDDTYGLAINLGDMGAGSNMFFNAFGIFPGQWILNEETGKLEHGSVQPGMKNALAELRDLYMSGAVYSLEEDQGALYGNCYTGVVQGKAGCLENTTNYVNVFKNLKRQNSDVEFTAFTLFREDGGDPVISSSLSTFRQYVVSAKCKYPAVSVILMNMFCDIEAAAEDDIAIQEEYMYSKDGTAHYYNLAPAITQRVSGDNKGIAERIREALETGDETVLKAGQDRQVYDNVKNYLDTGNVNNWYWERMYGLDGANLKVADAGYERFITLYQGAKTENMLTYEAEISSAFTIGMIQIVVGETELDTFDTMVEAWYEGGGTEITADVNAWYAEMTGEAE
ncbi:MAG: hypothetical protein IJD95_05750 [Clostridia bacterium]|nr:hypothetical protein [Clostridia bacterium]